MTEDTELLRRYVDTGSPEAFAELVDRRIGLVYSVALRRVRNEHCAQEVAQSVFIDLAKKAAALSCHASLVGWLYRSAYFAAATHLRTERNRISRETEAYLMREIPGDGSFEADWETLRPVLDELLSELDERDREAVLLRFFDDRPFGEIGMQLKLSGNAARMRVERALDKLHGLLASRGIRSTTAALGLLLTQQATAATAPAGLAAATTATALASANSVAISAFGSALHFMATTKTAVAVAGVLLIGSAGLAIHEIQAEKKISTKIIVAQREHDALAAKLAALRPRANQAETAAAQTKAAADRAQAEQAAELKKRQADAEARLAQGTAWMDRHPEVKSMVIRRMKNESATFYDRLFKTLGLTSTQIERFLDLNCLAKGGILTTPEGKSFLYELGGDPKAAKDELRALLGDEGFKQYQGYQLSMTGLQNVTKLAGDLSGSAEPMNPSQGERLLKILAQNRTLKSWAGSKDYDWEAIMQEAGEVLSKHQLEFLNDLRAQDEFTQASTRSRNPNL